MQLTIISFNVIRYIIFFVMVCELKGMERKGKKKKRFNRKTLEYFCIVQNYWYRTAHAFCSMYWSVRKHNVRDVPISDLRKSKRHISVATNKKQIFVVVVVVVNIFEQNQKKICNASIAFLPPQCWPESHLLTIVRLQLDCVEIPMTEWIILRMWSVLWFSL